MTLAQGPRCSQNPFLALSGLHITLILGGGAAACAMIQLALGVTIVPLFSSVAVCALSLAAFWAIGVYSAGAWVILLYAMGNVVVAMYAKTALGQPLQSHLYAPDRSFLLVLGGTAAMCAALVLANSIRVGRPLLFPTSDPAKLRWLSWSSFLLGVMFWYLNEHLRGPGQPGFGGFALFRTLVLMGVIARTAMLLEASRDRRHLDVVLVLMILAAIVLGLAENKKTATALPVVGYFATLLFYQRGFLRRQWVLMILGGIVFVTVLTPLIQAWRYLGQVEAAAAHQEIPASQRVSQMLATMRKLRQGEPFGRIRSLARVEFRHGYYNYFGDKGKWCSVGTRLFSRSTPWYWKSTDRVL